ncbi:Dienelactone hydrolase [Ruegeria halocynthiae]|uniref:Dienelactone hydrolase n=1 Tax=Ruegeria halocynthiae TaxID=985054 RepID=A0A1H3FKJ7_9RHOB|nr:CocE/NonD family hydrolase [Ruegeria halocynthiae]SDX91526.1 Dienelactone hydrolase [Ruegeria halocynthiae]
MKFLLTPLTVALLLCIPAQAEIVRFQASDGVVVTADFKTPDANAKTVIDLYHMAGASRGEYLNIAERLNGLGYATLAVDQRSGGQFNGVQNETVATAGGGIEFVDAIPDLVVASEWARETAGAQKVGVLGSSYSAGLVLVLAAKDRNFADAVMSFSPGEYYGSGDYVAREVGKIAVPVFLTAARNETGLWTPLQAMITSPVIGFIPNGSGRHGSSALDSGDSAEYWAALEGFLAQHLSP